MSEENSVKQALSNLEEVFNKTEDLLNEWKGQGCMQFSMLFNLIAIDLGWDDLKIKEHDPVIRYFISQHETYSSRRGAKGGIIRLADKERIEQEKVEKERRKQSELAARTEVEQMLSNRMMKITNDDLKGAE